MQRRVLAARRERAGLDAPRCRAVEHDEVGRRALDEPARAGPARAAQDRRRPVVSAAIARAERQPPGVDRREDQPERGLDPARSRSPPARTRPPCRPGCAAHDRSRSRRRSRRRARPGRQPRRRPSGAAGSPGAPGRTAAATSAPSAHGLRARPSASSASQAQRRAPASHSSVSARWCGVTSQVTGRPAGLRPPDELERLGRRQVGQVEPRPRLVGQASARIARSRATAAASAATGQPLQPEHGRDEPLVRLGAVGQRRVLGVVDDRPAEHPGVDQRVAQDRRRADRRAVVAEADRAAVGQLAERGQRLARPPDADGAVGQDLDRRAGSERPPRGPGPGRSPRRSPATCSA